MTPLRIAIAGAGAVVERFYLPAARRCREVRVVALADRDLDRARELAARFGVPKFVSDYRELHDAAEGVLIALPNSLHAPAAIEFLGRGTPVLVEKPMALSVEEARAMMEASIAGRAALDVGLVSRHASGARWIRRALEEGHLGPLSRFELEYGDASTWRSASSFLLDKEQAGGGVLVDLGSHMLDLAVWWLGEPELLEYRDDSMGGVEGECTANVSFAGLPASAGARVSLSRLRPLDNAVRMVGERRAVTWEIASDVIRLESGSGDSGEDTPAFPPPPRRTLHEMFAEQLRAFTRAARDFDGPTPRCDTSLMVLALIERSYRERRSLEFPWTRPALTPGVLRP